MALAIDASTPAVATQTNSATTTVAQTVTSPPNGALLYIRWCWNSQTGTDPTQPTITDNLGSHLTYTLIDWSHRGDGPATDGQAAQWWAVSSGSTLTITVTAGVSGSNNGGALHITVLTGADTTTPIGAHGKSGSTSAASIAQSYTAQATGGWGFIADTDWDLKGAQTAGTGCTLTNGGSANVGTLITYGFIRRTSADDTNGSSNTLNVTLPATSTNLRWVYAEILPASTSAPAYPFGQVRRGRIAVPVRARRQTSTPVRAQVNPPYQLQPVHRTRQVLGRLRGRVALFAPPQVVVAPPAYPVPAVHRLRQVLGRLRGRSFTPTPPQVVVAPPVYVPQAHAGRRAALLGRVRSRVFGPLPDQPTVPPRTVHRTRQLLGRIRGRTATVVPPQVVTPPPAYPPGPVHRLRAVLGRMRGRPAVPTPPQQAVPVSVPGRMTPSTTGATLGPATASGLLNDATTAGRAAASTQAGSLANTTSGGQA